jgi:hypothetical protein
VTVSCMVSANPTKRWSHNARPPATTFYYLSTQKIILLLGLESVVDHDDLRAWVAKLLRQELFYFVVDTGVSAVEHWTHHTSRLVSRLEVITKGTSINELVQWRLVRGLLRRRRQLRPWSMYLVDTSTGVLVESVNGMSFSCMGLAPVGAGWVRLLLCLI